MMKNYRGLYEFDLSQTGLNPHLHHFICKYQFKFGKQLVVKINSLSVDERLVLDGIVEGKIQRRIASDLDVSLRTVQFRRSSILKKLGVSTSAELLQLISEARSMGIYRESSGQTSQVG